MITKIRKRDGREDHFIPERITRAIYLAASRVAKEEGSEADYETAEYLTDRVVALLNKKFKKQKKGAYYFLTEEDYILYEKHYPIDIL